MEIQLAHSQGFCAGVSYAIAIVNEALEKYGTPIYVRHHIVHNTAVIDDFKAKGVIFVESLSDIPQHNIVILSAHGVAPKVYEQAKKKNLRVIDATCPLVAKIHQRAQKLSSEGIPVILIGHKNHQEIIGTSGYVKPELLHIVQNVSDIDKLEIAKDQTIGYVTQTTLSISQTKDIIAHLKNTFPNLLNPKASDICYATTYRQNAVVEIAKVSEFVIICGSANSSNSNRLLETAAEFAPSILIDKAEDLDLNLLKGKKTVGISSGASVPRYIVDKLIQRILKKYPNAKVNQEKSIEKEVTFKLPKI